MSYVCASIILRHLGCLNLSERMYIFFLIILRVLAVNSTEGKTGCHYQIACITDSQDVLAPSSEMDGQKDSPHVEN